MKPIIRIENLSKQYQIRTSEKRFQTGRRRLAGMARNPLSWIQSTVFQSNEVVWALRDVNFTVQPGEVIGLIGRNGAGKSTLLKILSRVVEPTTGRIDLYGRIGSLLEVGTGFHPELTGRENVFLNGAMLGMQRAEIIRKFDAIVAFSEIEKYIDTPVKRYSSGMYVRLAFSVAVHLEPEILVLDEVLAVGDTAFQIKCFNKMEEIRREGRTLLFVSHNMQAVIRMCQRAIYLSEGVVIDDGPSDQVVSRYLASDMRLSAERKWASLTEAPGDDVARLLAVRIRTADGSMTDTIDITEPVGIEMEYEVLEPGLMLVPNIHFYNEERICAFIVHDLDPNWRRKPRPAGRYQSTVWIPGNFLSEGTLTVGPALSTHDPVYVHFFEPEAIAFHVIDRLKGHSARGDYKGAMGGIVRPMLEWSTKFSPRGQESGALNPEEVLQ